VLVRPEKGQLILSIGKEESKISYAEAAGLMESLLKHLPGVPNKIELAWSVRHSPTCTIMVLHYYIKDQQKIIPTKFRAILSIDGYTICQSKLCPSIEEAEDHLALVYGSSEWDVTLYQDCLISYKKAEDEQVYHQAELYCEQEGITMAELWKRMRS
jgi:hypothetical protein